MCQKMVVEMEIIKITLQMFHVDSSPIKGFHCTSHMLLCGNLASSTLHQQGASSVEKTREREDIGF